MRLGVTPNGTNGSSMGQRAWKNWSWACSSSWRRRRGGLAGQAAGDAGAKADAAPLARYARHKGLVTFIEFDGLDAHEAAWRGVGRLQGAQ